MASDAVLGFHDAHISEPDALMVGLRSSSDRLDMVFDSSSQHRE